MPRPRKPTALLELSGAFKKHPERRKQRLGEPIASGEIGAEVENLPKLASVCWRRIVELAPKGVLKNCDEGFVELTARLWANVKSGRATVAEQALLLKCWQQLGCTPASRASVQVKPEDAENEFSAV